MQQADIEMKEQITLKWKFDKKETSSGDKESEREICRQTCVVCTVRTDHNYYLASFGQHYQERFDGLFDCVVCGDRLMAKKHQTKIDIYLSISIFHRPHRLQTVRKTQNCYRRRT